MEGDWVREYPGIGLGGGVGRIEGEGGLWGRWGVSWMEVVGLVGLGLSSIPVRALVQALALARGEVENTSCPGAHLSTLHGGGTDNGDLAVGIRTGHHFHH